MSLLAIRLPTDRATFRLLGRVQTTLLQSGLSQIIVNNRIYRGVNAFTHFAVPQLWGPQRGIVVLARGG